LNVVDAALLLGHNDVKQRRYNDFTGKRDGLPMPTVNPAGFNFQSVGLGNNGDSKDDQIEVRIASKQSQTLRWQGGLNWFDGSSRAGTLVGTDVSKLAAGQTMANSFLQSCYGSSTGGFGPCWGDARRTDKVTSPFAALEYDLNKSVTLSGEYRHTNQEKGQEILRNTSSSLSPPPGLGSATGFQTKDFSFNNYRASARWALSGDSMLYFGSANGTKAGGFNSAATVPEDLSYNPETSRTVELGGKFSLMDRKLQVGVALFSINTQNVQISGPSSNPANLGLVTKNFGSTQSPGIEIDFAAVPAANWKINGGIGYSDPKFKDGSYDFTVAAADCQAIPDCASRQLGVNSPSGIKQALNLSGLHVPRTSNVTANIGLQYNGSVSGSDWGWFARSDLRYESKKFTTQTNWSWIPERTMLNLRAGLDNGKYRVTAFINNATDSQVPEGALPSNRLNDSVPVIGAALPTRRTFGVTGSLSF
jgi:iron complex outermembrane recepter protein